jgi:hypothetical protein
MRREERINCNKMTRPARAWKARVIGPYVNILTLQLPCLQPSLRIYFSSLPYVFARSSPSQAFSSMLFHPSPSPSTRL